MEYYYENVNMHIGKGFNGYFLDFVLDTNENGRLLKIEKYEYDLFSNKMGKKLEEVKFIINKNEYEKFYQVINKDWHDVIDKNKKGHNYEISNESGSLKVNSKGEYSEFFFTITNENKSITLSHNRIRSYTFLDLVSKKVR